MIASSDVACASSWERPRNSTSAGTNSAPPPIPSSPAAIPATKPIASTPSTCMSDQQHQRRRHEEDCEAAGDRAGGDPLLERRAGDHAADRWDADQHALGDVHVAV